MGCRVDKGKGFDTEIAEKGPEWEFWVCHPVVCVRVANAGVNVVLFSVICGISARAAAKGLTERLFGAGGSAMEKEEER